MELAENKFARGVKTAIEENGAENGFEGVCEGGWTFAATVEFFASAQDEMLAEAKLARMVGERAAIDQFGASFCQGTFAEGGEIQVKLASENQLEDSIAQEFKALVGLDGHALFVSDGRVSHGEPQQSGLAKGVTELDLEVVVVGHGDQKAPNPKLQAPNKSQIPGSKRVGRLAASSLEVKI